MFSFSDERIRVEELRSSLDNPRAGALTAFEGRVRNHNDGRSVLALSYEACESLATREADRIIAEAKERFAIYDALCLHRVGDLTVGDIAVWVGVTAAHRDTAFGACRYIIDQIKIRLPIWKKESYSDGSSEWVNCQGTCSHDSAPAAAPHSVHDQAHPSASGGRIDE